MVERSIGDATAAFENYYDTLGVAPDVSPTNLRVRYCELAHRWHPDRFAESDGKADAAERFKRIRRAYEVLSDADERRRFDACRHRGRPYTPRHADAAAEHRSLREILEEVEPFTTSLAPIAPALAILHHIVIHDEERGLHVERSVRSDRNLCELPLVQARGTQVDIESLWLSNLGFILLLSCKLPMAPPLGTGVRFLWSGVRKIVIETSVHELRSVTFYGPTLAVSGVRFKLRNCTFTLLWLAQLYGIDVEYGVEIDVTVPPPRSVLVRGWWIGRGITVAPLALLVAANILGMMPAAPTWYLALLWFSLLALLSARSSLAHIRRVDAFRNLHRALLTQP